jgi:uncharacterized protein YbjT (DUF2867 family)
MKILLFGATGMIGEGVLRYVLESQRVSQVTAVTRRPLSFQHDKLSVVIEQNMEHLSQLDELHPFDVCLYCLGVSAVGMSEEKYRQQTIDLTMRIVEQIAPLNPSMVFEYVSGSGAGADSKQMWRRVKGEAEQAVLAFGFHDAYILRPGFIQPMRGATPRQAAGRFIYGITAPFHSFLKRRFPKFVTSTDDLAVAMLRLGAEQQACKIISTEMISSLSRE